MNIYIRSSDEIIELLGGFQKRTNHKKVRFSKLCVIVDVDEGKAVYNELTKSFVFLTDHDYNVVTKKENESSTGFQYLFSNYFLVPENYDEIKVALELRNHFYTKVTDDIRTSNLSTFTILPTTDCNARCFYCYQKGIKHHNMSEETAHKIAKFIIERHNPTRVVHLRWFGGEPLYNMGVIDIICSELKKANINFQSHIVSNSYLLTPELSKRAVKDWNLKYVQVTLDGTEETYNKAKHYIYKDSNESPFWRVINNMVGAVNNNIQIGVRLNVDNYNVEDMKNLLDLLYERFSHNIGLSIFPLFESSMSKKRTDEQRKELFEKVYELEDKAMRLGYLRPTVHDKYHASMCIVDDGHSIMFQPDGSIGLCEHHADDNKMSHIDNPVFKDEDIKAWIEKCGLEEDGLCDDCPLVPSCVRVKKCPEESVCNEQIKARKLRNERIAVANLYYNKVSAQNNNQQQNQQVNITPLEVDKNGVYTVPNNVNGYNPVIVKVENDEPYVPVFGVVRDKNTLCFIYLEQDLEYFPELTNEEFAKFLNEHTNLSDDIMPDDIVVTKEAKNSWFEVDLLSHPKLRLVDVFEWEGGEFCNGCIHLTSGSTKIFKW